MRTVQAMLVRLTLFSFLLATLLLSSTGCDSGDETPIDLDSAALTITIDNRPADHSPEIEIDGPRGFSETIDETTTFSDLVPGDYNIKALPISADTSGFNVDRPFRQIELGPGDQQDAHFTYEPIEFELAEDPVKFTAAAGRADTIVRSRPLVEGDFEDDDFDPYENTREFILDDSLGAAPSIGELVVMEPSDAVPQGHLGRVISVEDHHHGYRMVTQAAPITDLVEDGVIAGSQLLDYDEVDIEVLREGTEFLPMSEDNEQLLNQLGLAFIPDGFGPEITDEGLCFSTGDISLADNDDGSATGGGNICLGADFFFSFYIDKGRLQSANFSATFNQSGEIWVDLDGDLEFFKRTSIPMAKIPLPPVTITVYGAPIVINPYITLNIQIGASMDGDVSASLSFSNRAYLGFDYYRDTGTDDHFSLHSDTDRTLDATVTEYSLRGGMGPDLETLIYDSVGPTMGADLFAEYEVDYQAAPWWKLYLGIGGYIGLRLQVPGVPFLSWKDTIEVASRRWLIAESPPDENTPGLEITDQSDLRPDDPILACEETTLEFEFVDYVYSDREYDWLGDAEDIRLVDSSTDDDVTTSIYEVDLVAEPFRYASQPPTGVAVNTEVTQRNPNAIPAYATVLSRRLNIWGAGTEFNIVPALPDVLPEVPDMELRRRQYDAYPSGEFTAEIDGETTIDCIPPGQYELDMESVDVDGITYVPVVYEHSDQHHFEPVAVGDSGGLNYVFDAGRIGSHAGHLPPQGLRVRYEEQPHSIAIIEADNTHLLAEQPAEIIVRAHNSDFEESYFLSESDPVAEIRITDRDTYTVEAKNTSISGNLVRATPAVKSHEMGPNLAPQIGISYYILGPWVTNLNAFPNHLGHSGGTVYLGWDGGRAESYAIESNPAGLVDVEVAGDTNSTAIAIPENDSFDDRQIELILRAQGYDDSEQTSLFISQFGKPAGRLRLNPVGLPSGLTPTVEVTDGAGQTTAFTGPFPELSQRFSPGEYTVEGLAIGGPRFDYHAPPATAEVVHSHMASAANILFEPTTATLSVDANGPDDWSASEFVQISGPNGFSAPLSTPGAELTHLAPGQYTITVVQNTLATSQGPTFEAEQTEFDVSLAAGDESQLTIDYARQQGGLALQIDAGDASSTPTVEIFDDQSNLVETADASTTLWLEPGTYYLEAVGAFESNPDRLFIAQGTGPLAIDADESINHTVDFQEVSAELEASPSVVRPNEMETTLSWNVAGDDSLSLDISPDPGALSSLSGSQAVSFDDLDGITFTLTVANSAGEITRSVDIDVDTDPPRIDLFTINGNDSGPLYFHPDDQLTFEWDISGAEPMDVTASFTSDYLDPSGELTLRADEIECDYNFDRCSIQAQNTETWEFDDTYIEVYVNSAPAPEPIAPVHTLAAREITVPIETTNDVDFSDVSATADPASLVDTITFDDQAQELTLIISDQAAGQATIDLAMTSPFGDATGTFDLNVGVVDTSDDVDAPAPGTLRWALESAEEGEVVTFDPELFSDQSPGEIRLLAPLEISAGYDLIGQGPDATILKGALNYESTGFSDPDAVLRLVRPDGTADEVVNVTIANLTLTEGKDNGLYVNNSAHDVGLDLTLDNLIVEDNGNVDEIFTGGIFIDLSQDYSASAEYFQRLTITDVISRNNRATEAPGINIYSAPQAAISNVTIENNILPDPPSYPGGGGIFYRAEITPDDYLDPGLTLSDATIRNNDDIGLVTEGPALVTDTLIEGHDSFGYDIGTVYLSDTDPEFAQPITVGGQSEFINNERAIDSFNVSDTCVTVEDTVLFSGNTFDMTGDNFCQ